MLIKHFRNIQEAISIGMTSMDAFKKLEEKPFLCVKS